MSGTLVVFGPGGLDGTNQVFYLVHDTSHEPQFLCDLDAIATDGSGGALVANAELGVVTVQACIVSGICFGSSTIEVRPDVLTETSVHP